jgi:hypothetical protein
MGENRCSRSFPQIHMVEVGGGDPHVWRGSADLPPEAFVGRKVGRHVADWAADRASTLALRDIGAANASRPAKASRSPDLAQDEETERHRQCRRVSRCLLMRAPRSNASPDTQKRHQVQQTPPSLDGRTLGCAPADSTIFNMRAWGALWSLLPLTEAARPPKPPAHRAPAAAT